MVEHQLDSTAIISWIACIGVSGWDGWKARGRLIPSIRTQTAVLSAVIDINSHNAQDRSRWLLAVVWHYMQSY